MTEKALKQNNQKLVKAYARDLRLAPRKMRLLTGLVQGMHVVTAVVQLEHTGKKGAEMIVKLIKSAVANAKNNFSIDPEHLYIKSISADMGTSLKRYFPRARGSAFVIQRKMSHVNLVLEERLKGKAVKPRVSLFNKADKHEPVSIESKEAVNTKPEKEQGKKSQIFKDEQKVKLNKAQNKRRLFERRIGE